MKKFYLKEIRLELSKLMNIKGVEIGEFFSKFESRFTNKNKKSLGFINRKEFIDIIKSDELNIQIINNSNVKLREQYYKTPEYFENENKIYNFHYVKSIFKQEINEIILFIYKIIHDYEELNYTFISQKLKILVDINNDIKQVAHYCKDLKAYNFIEINVSQKNNNEKIIKINKKQLIVKEGKQITIDNDIYEDIKKNFENNQFCYQRLEISDNEANFLKNINDDFLFIKNNLNMRNYIQSRFSLIVDHLSVENNILFQLFLFEKLTSNEITLLLGMLGREKTVIRILSKMEKDKTISRSAERKGKIFSFLYYLSNGFILPEKFKQMKDFYLSKFNYINEEIIEFNCKNDILTKNYSSNEKNIIISDFKQISIPLFPEEKINDQESDFEVCDVLEERNDKILPKDSGKKLKAKSKEKESHPVKFDSKNMVDLIDLNINDFNFIINCLRNDTSKYSSIIKKYPFIKDNQIYEISKDKKIDIILDYFYNNLSTIGAKSFSNVSFNRYLYCLNLIRERKVINQVDLKKSIIRDLESNTYGYQIDRKTLRNILVNLEKIGLIKLADFKLTMSNKNYNYFQDKVELSQLKSIALRRDVQESEENLLQLINVDIRRIPKIKNKKKKLRKKEDQLVEDVLDKCNLITNIQTVRIENRDNLIKTVIDKVNHRFSYYYQFFFKALKAIYFVNNNLKFLFSIDSGSTKPMLFKFFDNVQPCRIILPNYLKNKYFLIPQRNHNIHSIESSKVSKVQTIANVINKEGIDPELESNIFSNNYKDCITNLNKYVKDMYLTVGINNNDLEFVNKFFKVEDKINNQNNFLDYNIKNFSNINKFAFDFFIKSDSTNQLDKFTSFLRKKRSKLKKDRIGQFVYTKIIYLYSLIQKIYFTPKITLKTLRTITASNINLGNFLIYFQKLGLIHIHEIGENEERDYSIELDKNIHLFFDII